MENYVSTSRAGVNERYLAFLLALKNAIETNPEAPGINQIRDEFKVGSQLTTILKRMDVIERRKGMYYWNGDVPSYDLVRELRNGLKTYQREFKQRTASVDLFTPMRKGRRWQLIRSFTIFKTKIKIFKLK